ncbi:MAG: L-histidine N(alpha)-methyltransferase [Deltaproteobacteria bacterium]|nr:L-histidine N(alpha)-methyltransferase [Deltaproteobacteria bacterium]
MQMKANQIAEDQRLEIRNYLDLDHREEMMRLVGEGLSAEPKWLHCKYLYDQRGSELFDEICQTREYYPTRTEMAIVERYAREIMDFFALGGGDLVEMGSGSNQKVRQLLDALPSRSLERLRYVPFDISESALVDAARELLDIYPRLNVMGIVGDYTRHLAALPSGRKLLVFFGSTLGNFNEQEGLELLKGVASAMNPHDRFLLGLDMVKPVEVLEAAYNDSQGVTESFLKNILAHLNRELGADFPLEHFQHKAFFNAQRECMEMHLQARQELTCRIDDLGLETRFTPGETIHVEIARKFTPDGAKQMLRQAGLAPTRWFSDEQGWFSLVELARVG